MDATIDDSQATQQYNKIDISSTHNRIRDCETEFESSHNSVTKESQANITKDLHREGLSSDSASLPDNSMVISRISSIPDLSIFLIFSSYVLYANFS